MSFQNPDLMFLKQAAVDLLADVRDGKVGADGANDRTGRTVNRTLNFLVKAGAVRKAERIGRTRRRYELTDDGREALAWHRPSGLGGES